MQDEPTVEESYGVSYSRLDDDFPSTGEMEFNFDYEGDYPTQWKHNTDTYHIAEIWTRGRDIVFGCSAGRSVNKTNKNDFDLVEG